MTDSYSKVAHTNPFPGLRSFELQDSALFFGRTTQIQELQQKLLHARLLAVVGSSGSGKSSLVKAGLLPQLKRVYALRQQAGRLAFFTPEATPLRNLAQALYNTFSEQNRAFAAATSPEALEAELLADPSVVLQWCDGANLLICIDQFEELFRYRQEQGDSAEVAQFIEVLLALTQTPDLPVFVVLTMRSDYLDECTDYPGLANAINNGSYLLPKMSRAEIEQAIVAPVALMGASITPALTARLLHDLGDKADQLPILQHALMRTWSYWQLNCKPGQPLSEGDYEAIGTMQRAISVHAEEVYGDLPDEKSRAAIEKVFKALIVLGPGEAGVVRPLSVGAISEIGGISSEVLTSVLNRFRAPDVAFLAPSSDLPIEDQLIIDLGHERIMNLWERLSAWVRQEVESAKLYRQVSSSAALYHAGKTGVWTSPELQIGLKWLADSRPTQAWAERYDPYLERAVNFLQYSKKQFDFELENRELRQQRELKRTRAFAIFLGIGSLVSLLFLIVSAVLRTQAQQSEDQALAEKKNALFERNRAEGQTREAITQKKISDQQEAITREQKQLTEEQRALAVQAQQVAVEKQKEAESAQQYADEQRKQALIASEQAFAASEEARRQEGLARQAQQEAVSQRTEAVSSRNDAIKQRGYAEQQRGKAVARTVAIQAYQMTGSGNDDLPALLAAEAYSLNLKNGGQADNPDVFNALAKSSNSPTVLSEHSDYVRTVAVAPGAGGPLLASGGDDGTVKLWSYANPQQAPQTLTTPGRGTDGVRALVFGHDGKTVLGGSEKGWLYSWDMRTANPVPVAIRGHRAPVLSLLLSPNGQQLVSIGAEGRIRTWKPEAGRLDSGQSVRSRVALHCAQLLPDGQHLLCGADQGQVLRFDLNNLKAPPVVFAPRELGDRVTALAISPDGKQLITGNSEGLLYVWSLRDGVPEGPGRLLSGRHASTVSDLAFSPDGRLLASCSFDRTVHIWDYASIATQQQPIMLRDFSGWVLALCFSNDSKRVIAGGADRMVRVRNVDAGDLYAELVKKVKRDLTTEEWDKYIGKDILYEKTKPE